MKHEEAYLLCNQRRPDQTRPGQNRGRGVRRRGETMLSYHDKTLGGEGLTGEYTLP